MNEQALKDEPALGDVVAVINPAGAGRVVLVCEHAANAIPSELNGLGLNEHALQSHIAWDLGALAVAEAMSAKLDAPLVAHRVSRLVYDCNRAPNALDAIPDISEYQKIPGNVGLSAADRQARTVRYYAPFCDTLSACLKKRVLPVLITVHSFTPVYKGQRRDVEIGILHDRDSRLADEILKCAGRNSDRKVMRNLPYGPEDGVTFTLVRHALPYGLLNVMIEIRNDLIADVSSQQAMAIRLSEYVTNALSALENNADLAQVS
ncbi:MAG: N-formylglutamate amidohydrolase [Rhodospirillales bacterium]|nr:N-formylglutamate amidohydrolase [Rhodospirillales bacterium]